MKWANVTEIQNMYNLGKDLQRKIENDVKNISYHGKSEQRKALSEIELKKYKGKFQSFVYIYNL